MLMCIRWILNQNEEIIYFTPTFNLAKNFYNKLVKIIPSELLKKTNSSDLIIESITGSQLRFFSGEAAQSARGSNCTRLIIDEAAYIKEEIDGQSFWYNIVVPLLKARGKTAVLISTPFTKSGFFYELCMKGLRGERGYKFIKKTIYDDALISPEEIEELKKGYPELAWKCEFECEFMSHALSVFPAYEDKFKQFTFNTNQKVWCGVDLSSVGTDNTVVTFVNEQQQVKQYFITGSLDMKYRQIGELINKYAPISTYIESNSIGGVMYDEILKYVNKKPFVHPFTTTNSTKKDMVSLISVAISNDNISFEETNKTLYSELGTFTYKLSKGGNITYAASGSNHDDTVMSLGLALQCKEDYNVSSTKSIYFNKKQIINKLQ